MSHTETPFEAPETRNPLLAEAFEYTKSGDTVDARWLDRAEQRGESHRLSNFLCFAARGARLSGELDKASRYAAEALRLARQSDPEFRAFHLFDAFWQQAMNQGSEGRATSAEKTIVTAVEQLGPRYRTEDAATAERFYSGLLMLGSLRFRQGKFSKAIESAEIAVAIPSHPTIAGSQRVLREQVLPELATCLEEHGDRQYLPAPQDEHQLWLAATFQGEYGFSPEVPVSPADRERYGAVLGLSRLPTVAEVEAAYEVDTSGELMRTYYGTETWAGERYELLTEEYVGALAARVGDALPPGATVLEVGAGDGRLSEFLRRELTGRGIGVIATDNGFSPIEATFPVEEVDCAAALERHRPDFVVSSWMPWKEDWTAAIRAAESVRGYVLIGPPDHCGTRESWGRDAGARFQIEGFEREALPELNRLKHVPHPWTHDSHGFVEKTETVAFWRRGAVPAGD